MPKIKKFIVLFFSFLCLLSCKAQNDLENKNSQKKQNSQKNLNMQSHKNELSKETSPYLLQHKDNPVHWMPWGKKAFKIAKERDVPIIISIGYSTCHWCHVMEHEVFEDEKAAKMMNDWFVCIKVDREERPEVDDIYMGALHAMNKRGGWPLNVVVTPEGKPFFGGTYFPKDHWMQILTSIHNAWKDKRSEIDTAADQLTKYLQNVSSYPSSSMPKNIWDKLKDDLSKSYDKDNPSWGKAPKFPTSQTLRLVLLLKENNISKEQAVNILTTMQDSGIHDLVGGGFHRYSTDTMWRVPHFEKMLYDNALLAIVYLIAGDKYQRKDFTRTGERTLNYMLRDLAVHNKDGQLTGYACGEDADDPNGEGSFYAWNEDLLKKVLSPEESKKIALEWNVTKGEAELNHLGHKEPITSHIPFPRNAMEKSKSENAIAKRLSWEKHYPALLKERAKRPRPHLDYKVLSSWNGLALSAFAHGARLTQKKEYIKATRDLATILLQRHTKKGLLRLSKVEGFINDYGFVLCGLMDAYDALGDLDLVDGAIRIADEAIDKFSHKDGGFFSTVKERDDLIMRSRVLFDNAYPAGNSTMALGLLRLSNLTSEKKYSTKAKKAIETIGSVAAQIPGSLGTLLTAYLVLERGPLTIVVTGTGEEKEKLLAACRKTHFLATIIDVDKIKNKKWPVLEGRKNVTEAMALFCIDKICLKPAKTINELEDIIKEYNKLLAH